MYVAKHIGHSRFLEERWTEILRDAVVIMCSVRILRVGNSSRYTAAYALLVWVITACRNVGASPPVGPTWLIVFCALQIRFDFIAVRDSPFRSTKVFEGSGLVPIDVVARILRGE